MTAGDSLTRVQTRLEALTDGDVRDLLDNAMRRVDGLTDWLESQRTGGACPEPGR